MHEQYFRMETVHNFHPTLWERIKYRLFGERIVEHAGAVKMVWYAYNGKLYLVKADDL